MKREKHRLACVGWEMIWAEVEEALGSWKEGGMSTYLKLGRQRKRARSFYLELRAPGPEVWRVDDEALHSGATGSSAPSL